jgi:type I restriction enzyme S subunit
MKMVALGELTASTRPICYGVLKPGGRVPNGIPLIRVTDITSNRFDASDLYTISESLDNEFRRSRLEGGELLLSIQGTVGRVAICPEEYAGANISRTIAVISPDERVCRPYLYHYLRHLGESGGFHTVGTTRASLNIATIRRLRIPLPILSEQKRIAAILDAADALRAKRRESIEQLDSLIQATFLEMFGDPRRANSVGRITTRSLPMGNATRIRTGKLDANAANEGGIYPFFTCAAEPLQINTAAYDCKAVLVAGNGDLNVKYYEGKFNAYQRTYIIESLDEGTLHPRFLFAFLDLYVAELRKMAIGGVIKYIKLPYLNDAVMQIPSIEHQNRFASIVESIEQQKARLKAHLAELDTLFASLQSRAFNGELVA